MQVADYNRGRLITDLKLKSWDYGDSLRSESSLLGWQVRPHKILAPHRNDNVNFPEQEYNDIFGGTKGAGLAKEYEKHHMDMFTE